MRAPAATQATFYEIRDGGGVRVAPAIDLSDRLPAAGFLSTADDLARFGIPLTGGKLVRPETAAMMFRSQRAIAGEKTATAWASKSNPARSGSSSATPAPSRVERRGWPSTSRPARSSR